MENSELQKIWKTVDNEINFKSEEELNILLTSKAKQTINKFLLILSISIFISAGVIVFLIVTALNRQNDLLYIINNSVLGIITLSSFFISIFSYFKLQNRKYNQPLNSWLNERISILSKWVKGGYNKLYLVVIPIIYILSVLSVHVYFEHKLFTEVLKTESSVVGLIVGSVVGLSVSYYVARKIRNYQFQNLEFLKDLHNRLLNTNSN